MGKFYFETVEQSSIEKITHSASSKDQVIINYNDSTSFELPVVDGNFDQNVDFKADIVNSSNGEAKVFLPKEAMSSDINKPDEFETRPIESLEMQIIEPFASSSISYTKSNHDNSYVGFNASDPERLQRLNTISDQDVVIFNGSVSTLDIKKFLGEPESDKYNYENSGRELRISALGLSLIHI